jgi:phage shock protein E
MLQEFLRRLTRTRAAPGAAARILVDQGALLLDVRSADEFRAEHIEGARNVPLGELAARLPQLGSKARSIVVYCRSGRRSAEAARVLRSAGFSSIHDLGPMSAWPGV